MAKKAHAHTYSVSGMQVAYWDWNWMVDERKGKGKGLRVEGSKGGILLGTPFPEEGEKGGRNEG